MGSIFDKLGGLLKNAGDLATGIYRTKSEVEIAKIRAKADAQGASYNAKWQDQFMQKALRADGGNTPFYVPPPSGPGGGGVTVVPQTSSGGGLNQNIVMVGLAFLAAVLLLPRLL